MMIAQKTLDLGRIGVRNGPDPGFFGQSLGQAWFPFQGRLLHDVWAKNLGSGPYRRSKRPRSRVFRPKALAKLGSLLREGYCMIIVQKTLDLGRIGVRNGPYPGFFGQSLAQAWFPSQGRPLHDDWAQNLGFGPYRRSKRPRSKGFWPKPCPSLVRFSGTTTAC